MESKPIFDAGAVCKGDDRMFSIACCRRPCWQSLRQFDWQRHGKCKYRGIGDRFPQSGETVGESVEFLMLRKVVVGFNRRSKSLC